VNALTEAAWVDDPPWSVVVLLFLAAIAVNTLGYRAMKRGVVGYWFSPTVALATLVLLVGADYSLAVCLVGILGLLALGLYGGSRLSRGRRTSSKGRHREPSTF